MSRMDNGVADRARRGAVLGVVVLVVFLLGACAGSGLAQALRPYRPSDGFGYLDVTFVGAAVGGAVASLVVARLVAGALKLGRPWVTSVAAGLLNVSIILVALNLGSRLPPFAAIAAILVASFPLSGALAAVLVARQPPRHWSEEPRVPPVSSVDG